MESGDAETDEWPWAANAQVINKRVNQTRDSPPCLAFLPPSSRPLPVAPGQEGSIQP